MNQFFCRNNDVSDQDWIMGQSLAIVAESARENNSRTCFGIYIKDEIVNTTC